MDSTRFLLAQLHMDSLSDKTSIKMVKKALDALPKGSKALDAAYDGAMQRIDSQLEGYRHLAKQLLGWLTYSERLMSVQEIQYALAIEPGESSLDEDNLSDVSEIVGYCAGLVIVEEDTRSLRLVHYTTQEYFRQNGGKHLVAAQQNIAISCLTYLLYETFGDGWVYKVEEQVDRFSRQPEIVAEARLQKHPFLGYAARYWANHASVCDQKVIKELTMSFARHDHKVSSAGQAMLLVDGKTYLIGFIHETESSNPLSAMHVLAYIGYKEIVSELLKLGFEADVEDGSGRTPLWWAVEGGHHAVVELLLSETANVNNRGSDWNPGSVLGTPLHIAVSYGHTSIVKLLLNRADINVNLGDRSNQTALHQATTIGSTSIVELLLDYANIDVNIPDNSYYTPLQIAVTYFHTSIVKLLLNRADIYVNLRDAYGQTALYQAAGKGHTSIVELLLDRADIDVNIPDNRNRQTPLHKAISCSHTAIVELLLDCADVDVNAQDNADRTILQEAAAVGCTSIVKLLLADPKTDLKSSDNWGRYLISPVKDVQGLEFYNEFYNISNEDRDRRMLAQEECLDIIRAAIEERNLETPVNMPDEAANLEFGMTIREFSLLLLQ